jgi:hypothetical protein
MVACDLWITDFLWGNKRTFCGYGWPAGYNLSWQVWVPPPATRYKDTHGVIWLSWDGNESEKSIPDQIYPLPSWLWTTRRRDSWAPGVSAGFSIGPVKLPSDWVPCPRGIHRPGVARVPLWTHRPPDFFPKTQAYGILNIYNYANWTDRAVNKSSGTALTQTCSLE